MHIFELKKAVALAEEREALERLRKLAEQPGCPMALRVGDAEIYLDNEVGGNILANLLTANQAALRGLGVYPDAIDNASTEPSSAPLPIRFDDMSLEQLIVYVEREHFGYDWLVRNDSTRGYFVHLHAGDDLGEAEGGFEHSFSEYATTLKKAFIGALTALENKG